MRNLKLPALITAFLLSLATVSPAVAAPPTNTNIQVGTSSTGGVPNINVDVSTTSSTVSLTIQIAGSTAAPGGTSAGSYQIAGGIKVVKSPGARSAGVFHRDPTSADPAAVNTETGFASVGGGGFTGTFNAGNVSSNPLTYSQSTLGGGSGEVAACIPLVYYHASNSSENIWYCTQTFVWPASSGGGGYPACQANGSPAALTDVGVSRTTLSPGETYRTTIGGQPVASACSISISSGYWVRTSINSTVVTVSGTVFTTSILYSNTSAISYESLLTGLGNQGYSTPIQAGDVWKREVFTTSSAPTLADTPITTMTMTLGVSSIVTSPSVASNRTVYSGPEILALDDPRPMVAGGKLVFTGKNLSSVTSASIGSLAATLSYDAAAGLTIATPPALAPGKYDLVMQSSYGKLTHINAVTIKAPTPTATIGFRSDAPHLNEKQVLDLVAFNQTLNPDYEKVRCIVNSADPKVAKRIADLVCAQVARGEARNVEVIKDIRDTYSGEGFWVRVYAAG